MGAGPLLCPPLEAKDVPVGISDVELLHSVWRHPRFSYLYPLAAEVVVGPIHVRATNQVPTLKAADRKGGGPRYPSFLETLRLFPAPGAVPAARLPEAGSADRRLCGPRLFSGDDPRRAYLEEPQSLWEARLCATSLSPR